MIFLFGIKVIFYQAPLTPKILELSPFQEKCDTLSSQKTF